MNTKSLYVKHRQKQILYSCLLYVLAPKIYQDLSNIQITSDKFSQTVLTLRDYNFGVLFVQMVERIYFLIFYFVANLAVMLIVVHVV